LSRREDQLTKTPERLDSGAQPSENGPGNRRSVYVRIARTIADRMSSGVYPPGSLLPSGSRLCAEFGVSPMTINRAFAELKERGLVSSVKGRGTYARSLDLSDSSFRLDSAAGAWLGSSAEIRLLSVAMARADEQTAGRLQIPVGQRIVTLRRLVSEEGHPVMLHTEHVICDPLRPLLESQLQLTSLHAFLRSDRGERFKRGELRVRAINLDEESSRILGQELGAAALRLEHLFRDADGRPVTFGWFLLRADHFELFSELS
jgi:GntR family transcriptional regulator